MSCHAQHLERVLYHEEFHGIRPFLKHCSESVKSLTTKLETKFLARASRQAAVTATNEDGQSKALYSECYTGKSPSNYIGIPVLAKDLIAPWMICLMKDLCILID